MKPNHSLCKRRNQAVISGQLPSEPWEFHDNLCCLVAGQLFVAGFALKSPTQGG